jgi:hypothetical protein
MPLAANILVPKEARGWPDKFFLFGMPHAR